MTANPRNGPRAGDNRIPENVLRDALSRMALIRAFEEEFREQTLAGNSRGFNHIYAGQEACAVSISQHLTRDDAVMSSHRAQGHYLAKGGDMQKLAREMIGRPGGCSKGKGGSMHVCDMDVNVHGGNGIIGASTPHALGAALAFKMRGEPRIAVAYLGDGGSNQGGFLESLNLASVYQLPVLFVVEDNGFAESTGSGWSIGGDLVSRAKGFGIEAAEVEAVDYPDVYRLAGRYVEEIRAGGGPRLMHVHLPMFYGHYIGDPELYRAKGEARRERKERDCIKRLMNLLVSEHDANEAELARLLDDARTEVKGAFEAALAESPQDMSALTEDVLLARHVVVEGASL
jgi:TPP-dependent pyruvate/acetoin dehydrogenase alpha subunit